MRLFYKILAILAVAFVLPVVVLGVTAYRSMQRINAQATNAAAETLKQAELDRMVQSAREMGTGIDAFLLQYQKKTEILQHVYQYAAEHHEPTNTLLTQDLYPGQDKAGLPGYGFVDPILGAYADYDHRSGGSPWVPRPVVERVRRDPAFRAEVAGVLHQLMRVNPLMVEVGTQQNAALDLVWIVTTLQATNVHPPYHFRELIRKAPEIVDADENSEDYVRELDPERNPERRLRWLEPYYDLFKGVWMTSCAAPLYKGDRFLGTVGTDILLRTITEQIVALRPGSSGYAFLLSAAGKPLAVPEAGVRDLLWTDVQQRALREILHRTTERRWSSEEVDALSNTSLDRSPDASVRELVARMHAQTSGSAQLNLGGRDKFVAFAPVPSTGWSVGLVRPVEVVVEPSLLVRDTISEGTARVSRQFVLMTGFLLFLSIVVGVLMHYWTIRPVVRLASTVERVSWENLDLAPEPTCKRHDEVGNLNRRFGEMLRQLRTARDEVERKNKEAVGANQQLALANRSLEREIQVRREAETAVLREKELIGVTLHSIGDAVITTDLDGHVIIMNPVAEQLTGWTWEEARSHRLDEVFRIVSEEDRRPCVCPVRRVVESGQAMGLANSTLLLRRDGMERYIAHSGAPIRDNRGMTVGVVLVFRDVTEQRRMSAEMLKIAKLESLAVMASGIAHDFNNLLTIILGSISLVHQDVPPNSRAAAWIENAEKATQRAQALTRQLLTFTTGGEPVCRVMDLTPLLGDVANFAFHGSTIHANVHCPTNLWPVNADEGQLSQVLHNILINAREAMLGGGTVNVVASNVELHERYQGQLDPGRYVRVTVSDQGSGIAPDVLPRIFDPFFSTKARGSGLGLAICFSIVKKHGGLIEAGSQPGKGAQFRILLPAAAPPAEKSSAPVKSTPRGTGKILVMDDDDMIRRMLGTVLRRLGYEPVLCAEGSETLRVYREHLESGDSIAGVILDLTITNGMGGLETIQSLRVMDPHVKAIVSSGYSASPVVADPEQYGFSAAIIKPYFLSTVASVLERLVVQDAEKQ